MEPWNQGPRNQEPSNQEPRNDAALIAGVRRGDAGAFGELYAAHVGAVTRAARCVVAESDAVADIVQEAFARALERIDTLREPSCFRAWVTSIARHLAADHGRDRARVAPAGDDRRWDAAIDLRDTAEELVERDALTDLLRRCVASLSCRDAQVVTLIAVPGCGPAQVAAALGISNGAAKVVVHRARRRLAHAVEDSWPTAPLATAGVAGRHPVR
jgi:RNA polymerase sigma factor (sigma-70 family)